MLGVPGENEPKWVKVNNHDTVTSLNFKDNGVNLASAAPAAPSEAQVPPGQPASQITPANWPPETPMSSAQAAILEAAYRMKYQKEIQAGTMPSTPGNNPLTDNDNNNQQQQQKQQKRPY